MSSNITDTTKQRVPVVSFNIADMTEMKYVVPSAELIKATAPTSYIDETLCFRPKTLVFRWMVGLYGAYDL
jgi:hypothetical protein